MGIASRVLSEVTKRGLAKEVLSDSAKKLVRAKLFGAPLSGLKKWYDRRGFFTLNPMNSGERLLGNIFGVETRNPAMRKIIKTPGRAATADAPPTIKWVDYGNGTLGKRVVFGKRGEEAVKEVSEMVPKQEMWDAPRNSIGKLGATLGGIAGLGTYLGIGYGAKSAYNHFHKDPNAPTAEGQEHPVVSEEEQALRDSFAKKNLGGSDSFTPEMYKNMTKNSWVTSAIKAIGTERYKKLREKGDSALLHRTLVSAIHADPEKLKQASSGDYVLPGIYSDDTGPNVQVMHLNKGDKGYNPKILNHMFTPPEEQ